MPTLSQVTTETKAIFKWGAIAVIGLILILIGIRGGTYVKDAFFPEPTPAPDASFGSLPQVVFPQQTISNKDFTYSINTLSGELPEFSDRTKVYKMEQLKPDLLALKKTQSKVSSVRFTQGPQAISETVYRWTDDTPIKRTISIDIFSSNFNLTSNYLTDPNVASSKNLPDTDGAIALARDFLASIQSWPDDIDEDKTKTNLFAINNGTLVPVPSISGAQIIQVFFFQNNINDMQIYYPKPKVSPISILVGGGDNRAQVLEANYSHQNITKEGSSYAILTSEEALSRLKSGDVYIGSYFGTSNNIKIEKISLGYYLGQSPQEYLMPIIVFEGQDGFIAYMQAVRDEWINN